MTLFAVAATMVVPSMLAWTEAVRMGRQRDAARQALDRAAAWYRQAGWDSAAWTAAATASDRASAVGTVLPGLGQGAYTRHASVALGADGPAATLEYAVVAVVDDRRQAVNRVMRLRARWTGPGGKERRIVRLVQRNAP
jgi:type II secretory pathway pseudopilin PulG